jgi:hypothetical protein
MKGEGIKESRMLDKKQNTFHHTHLIPIYILNNEIMSSSQGHNASSFMPQRYALILYFL